MNNERELERHNKVMKQISEATNINSLPNTSLNKIVDFLVTNVSYNKEKLPKEVAIKLLEYIKKYGNLNHTQVKRAFIREVNKSFEGISKDEIVELYVKVLQTKRVEYLLKEFNAKNIKVYELTRNNNLEMHNQIMKEIKDAYEIKDLPKVGIGELNKRLLKAFNSNSKGITFKASDIKGVTSFYLRGCDFSAIRGLVKEIVEDEKVAEEIIGALILDESIDYTVGEINAKELRKLKIYEMNHEEVMDQIKEAKRISQLPPNVTESSLTGYLNGNTTIITNDDRISSTDLKNLTSLLLSGKVFEDTEVKDEIRKLASTFYPEVEDAFILLYRKLKNLPRTYYIVDEINYAKEREAEFIERSDANVNVYLMPNNKSPLDGGKFYNVYINRVGELDLEGALPQNLEEIVPEGLDIDSVEWYVQEYIDETFKTAGGIILARDESIGNVKVFRPNDGTIGITVEAKAKMDEIEDLDKQIEEKKQILASLEASIQAKYEEEREAEERLTEIVDTYEEKALSLQSELISKISEVKDSVKVKRLKK